MSHTATPESESRNKKIPIALAGGESLGLLLTSLDCPAAFPGATAHRFELSSRGDRVAGRLLVPEERSGPCPLILIQGDAGTSYASASLDFAGSWVGRGFALATLDLPLHGERSSPKFSERLLDAIENARPRGGSLDANGRALLLEFTDQSICDLSRSVDGLSTLPAIDGDRIGVMGLGHGAAIVALFASLDSRTRAVVLAHCSATGLPEIDPVQFVREIIGPRAVLLLESTRASDKHDAESDAALFDACAEPKLCSSSDDEFGKLGAASAERARAFFADQLSAD
jgi:dienelactone hydrolase